MRCTAYSTIALGAEISLNFWWLGEVMIWQMRLGNLPGTSPIVQICWRLTSRVMGYCDPVWLAWYSYFWLIVLVVTFVTLLLCDLTWLVLMLMTFRGMSGQEGNGVRLQYTCVNPCCTLNMVGNVCYLCCIFVSFWEYHVIMLWWHAWRLCCI